MKINEFKIQSHFDGSYIYCKDGLFSYVGEWANRVLNMFIKLDIMNDYNKKIIVLRDGLVIYGEIK